MCRLRTACDKQVAWVFHHQCHLEHWAAACWPLHCVGRAICETVVLPETLGLNIQFCTRKWYLQSKRSLLFTACLCEQLCCRVKEGVCCRDGGPAKSCLLDSRISFSWPCCQPFPPPHFMNLQSHLPFLLKNRSLTELCKSRVRAAA